MFQATVKHTRLEPWAVKNKTKQNKKMHICKLCNMYGLQMNIAANYCNTLQRSPLSNSKMCYCMLWWSWTISDAMSVPVYLDESWHWCDPTNGNNFVKIRQTMSHQQYNILQGLLYSQYISMTTVWYCFHTMQPLSTSSHQCMLLKIITPVPLYVSYLSKSSTGKFTPWSET